MNSTLRRYGIAFLLAIIAEGIPILLQILFTDDVLNNMDQQLYRGFYIYPGFFLFEVVAFTLTFIFAYFMSVKFHDHLLSSFALFLVVASLLELGFYSIQAAQFSFVFLLSPADKVIAIVLAFMVYRLYKDAFYRLFIKKK